jgi:thiol-disulfide isomerase/thioredoxin
MLATLLPAARILLAAVFVVAAVAKLADLEGARRAAGDFGVPPRLAGGLAPALAIAELAVAALLIPGSTAVVGAAAALALLLLFSGAIGVSLARGRAPDCHCFGRLHSAPAGRGTLARNGALASLAAFALAGSLADRPEGALDWIGGLSEAEALMLGTGLALAVVAAAFVGLLRSYGKVLLRVERLESALAAAGYELDEAPAVGLEPRTPAPDFEALGALLERRLPLLLVFISPGCGPCEALMPDLATWQSAHAEHLTVAVLANGESAEIGAEAERHGLVDVFADAEGQMYDAYEASGTPSAVLIAADGTVASFVAAGPSAIAELVAGVLDAPGLPIGAPAPALHSLTALDAGAPRVGERASLVLFWNPDCGFCRSMHEELLAWEAAATGSSPQLLLISSGDQERTRAEGFRSPVLLDTEHAASEAFRAGGTPSAVLVDADGRVASELLMGAEAILGRLRGPQLVHVG